MNSFGKTTFGQGFTSSSKNNDAIIFNNQGGKKGRGRYKVGNKTVARYAFLHKIQKAFNKIRGINTATVDSSRSSGPPPVARRGGRTGDDG